MEQSFPYDAAQVGYGWSNGDINYNPGGGWFAVFFDGEDTSGSYGDQLNMGRLDDGAIETLRGLKGSYDITIRKACKKMAMILDSGSSGVYAAAERIYHGFLQGWYGAEDCGIFEYPGAAASSPQNLEEVRQFGRSL